MKCTLPFFLAACLLTPSFGFSQQSAKPVLSATPPAKAAAGPVNLPPGAGTSDPTYVIGPDDSIKVSTWEEQALSDTLLVRPDGMISLPLIGDIQAAGLTPPQLSDKIATELKKYKTDPVVTVTVLQVNSKRVYLAGEFNHAGPIAISPNVSILQTILTAGGLSPYAKKSKIYILRGPVGHQQKLIFDYTKALKTGNMQGITLEPGDTVVAP